jgi:1-acyl-sn-glycerol-3-phosphate acyltransferase
MRKFKPGAKMIADKYTLRVQPIVLVNTSRYYNIKKKHYAPGTIQAVALESFIADKKDAQWLNNLQISMQKIYDDELANITCNR